MARLVKKERKAEEAEEQFLSLIFPMRKKWIAARPEVRARRSGLKRVVTSFCSANTKTTRSISDKDQGK